MSDSGNSTRHLTPHRRDILAWGAGAAAFLAMPTRAPAADYPTRPVRWILGFPAGGAADIVVRIVAAQLSDQLGQQVVVENRPGAGTSLATSALQSAPADGHTILLLGSSTIVHALTQDRNQASVLQHIAPVAGLTITAFVIAVHAEAPYLTLAELIDDARAHPGKLRMGSYGVGTQSQLAALLFSEVAGVDVVHVPYRGGAPLMVDLLGRHIHVAVDTVASALPYMKEGMFRALAVTSGSRLKTLSQVPAAAETLPGYEMTVWTGIGVSKNTPPELIQRLGSEIKIALSEPKVVKKLAELAIDPMPLGIEDFAAFLSTETRRTRKLLEKTGIKVQ